MKNTQINFTVSAAEKQRIAKLAKSCGLKQGEYLRQRALGYAEGVSASGAVLVTP